MTYDSFCWWLAGYKESPTLMSFRTLLPLCTLPVRRLLATEKVNRVELGWSVGTGTVIGRWNCCLARRQSFEVMHALPAARRRAMDS